MHPSAHRSDAGRHWLCSTSSGDRNLNRKDKYPVVPTNVDLFLITILSPGIYDNDSSSFLAVFMALIFILKFYESRSVCDISAVPKSINLRCRCLDNNKFEGYLNIRILLDRDEWSHGDADTRWYWQVQQHRTFLMLMWVNNLK